MQNKHFTIMGFEESNTSHRLQHIVAIVITCLLYLGMLFFNAIVNIDVAKRWDVFGLEPTTIVDKYKLDITPARWTFAIWVFVFVYQGLWLIYGVSTVFRRSASGSYLYVWPPFFPIWIYVIFSIVCILNVSWLFLWDHEIIAAAFVFMLLGTVGIIVCIVWSHRALSAYWGTLMEFARQEIWLIRMLLQNGLTMYATWGIFLTSLNFSIVLAYSLDMRGENASTIGLSIIIVCMFVYFVLENFVFWDKLIYTFTPWLVIPVALIGILHHNWDMSQRNTVYTLVIFAIFFLLLIVRIVLTVLRTCLKSRGFVV